MTYSLAKVNYQYICYGTGFVLSSDTMKNRFYSSSRYLEPAVSPDQIYKVRRPLQFFHLVMHSFFIYS